MNLSTLFARKEHFFILEVGPESLGGVLLAVDREKNIFVKRVFSPVPRGSALRWKNWWGFPRVAPIAALDSSLAHTAIIPVSHVRERIREPLRAQELEDILGQHIGRALPQARKDAARELGVDELDALLAKAQVADFKIDTHRVLNPLGFRAQRVDAVVRLTFTTREAFTETKRIFGGRGSLFFADITDAELSLLERVETLPLNLIRIRPWQSSRFSTNHTQAGYAVHRGDLAWRARGFEEAVQEAWGVSQAVAHRLYKMRIKNEFGEPVLRFFDRIFLPRVKSFFAEVTAMKTKGAFYVDATCALPFAFNSRKILGLKEPPMDALLERLGFTLDADGIPFSSRSAFRFLAAFSAFYYDKSDAAMNAWLTKHLSWLGSPVEKRG